MALSEQQGPFTQEQIAADQRSRVLQVPVSRPLANPLASSEEDILRNQGNPNWQGVQTAPLPPQTSFSDELSKFAVGNRQAIELPADAGLLKKLGAGLVNAIVGAYVQPTAQILNVPAEIATRSQVLSEDEHNQVMAKLDEQMASKIRQLHQVNTPEAKMTLQALKEHFANQGEERQLLVKTPFDDASNQQVFFTTLGNGVASVLFSKGVTSLAPFKQASGALFAKEGLAAAPDLLNPTSIANLSKYMGAGGKAKALAVLSAGFGTEFGIYNTLYGLGAHPGEGQPSPTASDIPGLFGGGFALGSILGPAMGVAGHWFSKAAANRAAQVAKDLLENADLAVTRGVDEIPMFNRRVITNLNGKPTIKDVSAEVFKSQEVPKTDLSTAIVGDIVRTKNEGLIGVVTGFRDQLVPKGQVALSEQLMPEIESISKQLRTPGLINEPQLKFLNQRLDNLIAQAEKAQEENIFLRDPEDLTPYERIKSVELKVRKGGSMETAKILIPEKNLIGGKILRREFLVPTGMIEGKTVDETIAILTKRLTDKSYNDSEKLAFEKTIRSLRGEAEKANAYTRDQLSRDRFTVNHEGQDLPISSGPREVIPKKGAVSPADLELGGNQLTLTPGFKPKRLTLLSHYMLDEWNLKKSGVDIMPYHQQEALMDKALLDRFNTLKDLSDAVFKEHGLHGADTLIGAESRGLIGRLIRPSYGKKVSELSGRLFDAANGDLKAMGTLSFSELRLVQAWKNIARNLLDETNAELIKMGKEPVVARTDYITNVLTAQAQAMFEISRALPPQLVKQLFGDKNIPVFQRANADQVLNLLLQARTGGLPIKRDFFGSVNAAVTAHTRFAYMQPVVNDINKIIEHWRGDSGLAGAYESNYTMLKNFADRMAGTSKQHEFLRAYDQKILEGLIAADKFMGTNLFSEEVSIKGWDGIRLPKDSTIKAVSTFGPGHLPAHLRRLSFAKTFMLKLPYMLTNMSQPFALTTSKMNGPLLNQYRSLGKGMLGAIKDIFSPEMWEHYRRTGVLSEITKFENLEGGDLTARAGGSKGGFVNRAINMTTDISEFFNHVSTIRATYENIISTTEMKGGLSHNAYWEGLDGLSKGELSKEAERISKEIDAITQGKFGITYRAPVQDNPLLSLTDQYNTFTRIWANNYMKLVRQMKEDPKFVEAWKSLWGGEEPTLKRAVSEMTGKTQGKDLFMKYITDPTLLTEQRGQIVRFYMNNLALLAITSALGVSTGKAAWDLFGGGGTRFLSGAVDMLRGMRDHDINKLEGGIESMIMPPSIPPVYNAALDTYSYMFGGNKLTLKKLAMSNWLPFRDPTIAVDALTALVTNQPVIVRNPRTGDPSYVIDPKDAVNQILFGFSGNSVSKRNAELDELAKLRAETQKRSDNLANDANEILDKLSGMTPSEKDGYITSLKVSGVLTPNMAKEIIFKMKEEAILKSGLVESQLKSLDAQGKADFIRLTTKGMTEEEKSVYYAHLYLNGSLSPDVLGELQKKNNDKKGIWGGLLGIFGIGLTAKPPKNLQEVIDQAVARGAGPNGISDRVVTINADLAHELAVSMGAKLRTEVPSKDLAKFLTQGFGKLGALAGNQVTGEELATFLQERLLRHMNLHEVRDIVREAFSHIRIP